MNKQRTRGGPNPALLLLVPAVVMIAKGARRRRAMWESGWGAPSGPAAHGHGHFGGFGEGFGPGGPSAGDRGAFRLPPKIEWMLESWHTRAHEAKDAADTTTV